jgi:SNF2 family DNA or RNA helicase
MAKAAFELEANCRWVLTGTPIQVSIPPPRRDKGWSLYVNMTDLSLVGVPIQNKIDDLFSLVKFLRVDPFCEYDWFNRIILRPIKNAEMKGFEHLQLLVRFHCLRRTKDQKARPMLGMTQRSWARVKLADTSPGASFEGCDGVMEKGLSMVSDLSVVQVKFADGSMRSLVTLPPKMSSVLTVDLHPEDKSAYDALYHFTRK